MKRLMIGNEAIAKGALDAGVKLVSSYPGTPSTEITEFAAKSRDIHIEWAPNEKVAVEVAAGAAIGGARAMSCMKHVGVNVAADPLFTMAYTGVRAGLVIVVADDPGMHSSQNEQDSRYYAKSAHIPMLEPANSAECYSFTRLAFDLSEEYDTPVFVRLTTRIAHAQSVVEQGQAKEADIVPYEKQPMKYVMMPMQARLRHLEVEKREQALAEAVNSFEINKAEYNDTSIGVICSGAVYQYVKEALPNASVLKLGMVYPLPKKLIKEFAAKVDRLIIAEELEPIIETEVKAMGIACQGKELFTVQGEYSAAMLKKAILGVEDSFQAIPQLPARPPVLCPGCPHRSVFYILKKLKLNVTGDIGCYTLGANAPLSMIDTCVCMGASIGVAHGMDRSCAVPADKTVAVIGDSTFLHSGITSLLNVVYNGGKTTVIILDNSITGMTGHQQNPATGKDIRGDAAPAVDLEKLCQTLGVGYVKSVDPFDIKSFESIVKEALAVDGPAVVIAKRPCALIVKDRKAPLTVNEDKCIGCKRCMGIGCPAISFENKHAKIDVALCVGCGQCVSVCPANAIVKGE